MAVKAKLSILGLYRWNNHLFDNMSIPEDVDLETLKWKILEECAELEALHADPYYMQLSIKNWSASMLPSWEKMQEALTAEYNPIWNKDGTISETYSYGAITANGSTTDSVAGFNSDTTHQRESTTSNATQNAHTDTITKTEQGNIGVTESSAMVRHEVELRSDFNIYQIIVKDFKKQYCLMIY